MVGKRSLKELLRSIKDNDYALLNDVNPNELSLIMFDIRDVTSIYF